MGLLFNAPWSPLLAGANLRLLASALAVGSTPPAGGVLGPTPDSISGLSGWWDAGLLSGLQGASGQVLTASNLPVALITDKSGNGNPLTPYHIAVDTTPAATLAVPRVNGFLGAAGAPDAAIVSYGPSLDPDWGLSHPGFELGAGAAWTRYLVWTRPNWRQGTIANPLPASANAQVLLLHDGTIQGSAQCWFHEAACWERALSAADIATLIAAQGRWVLGARRGINLLVMGQSNAAWFINAGGALALAHGTAWYLGAAAYGFTAAFSGSYVSPNRY
jgi:hypothetical protein